MRRIEDGYQYVGGFPAHMWRAAAADEQYKTLHYGIRTFPRRWGHIRKAISRPMHYVSIGPGTGEKDAAILRHLEAFASEPIVYIPVDISADLLRMSLEVSVEDIDENLIDVLPVELDITSNRGLDGLRQVIGEMTDGPVLISLLGNTLGNFRDDSSMLGRISTLLSSAEDRFLIEVATTEGATEDLATLAGQEYAGSVSFRHFVMAALAQYTNVTPESGEVIHQGRVIANGLEVATMFTTDQPLDIYVNDNDHFVLSAQEPIELYRSRKYTSDGITAMYADFEIIGKNKTAYSNDFGVATYLLKPLGADPVRKDKWPHFSARPPQ
jgi:uncharacterized SAM-dependent methyltransferase